MDCRARPPTRCDDGQVTDPRGTHPRRSAPLGVVLFTWAPPVLAWATGVAAVVAGETTVAALALVAAIASSVFVTTFTDMAGFALLLGLAGMLLL